MFSIWIASRELLGLCFCSGYCVCGAKYWKLWYRIPWCMLTLAAAKGFWGCFSCALLRLHCPPPTISSGRGVPCSHCSLSWGGGSTGKTLWCISGWKLISNVSEVFRENTSMWELFFFFFFFWEAISSCWTLLHPLSNPRRCLSGYRKPSATSRTYPPLTACMVHEPLSLRSLPPARGSVNIQTTVEQRTRARLIWPVSEQHRMSPGWMGMWAEGRTGGKAESANKRQSK